MPLTSRDVLFILRAQDFVSRDLRNIGRGFARFSKTAQAQQRQLDDTLTRSGIKVQSLGNEIDTARHKFAAFERPYKAHNEALRVHNKRLNDLVASGAVSRKEVQRQIAQNDLRIAQNDQLMGRARRATDSIIRGHQREIASSKSVAAQEKAAFAARMQQQQLLAGRMMAVGATLATVGAGMTVAGAAGLGFFSSATQAAAEFRQGAALAQTQASDMGITIESIEDLARDIASVIPAPLEQMNETLYEIFSSLDVNIHEARSLTEAFAKAGVAGQVDMKDAASSAISVMNAWPETAGNVSDIMDIQFRMVERGRGTYGEFATAVGKTIPAAVRAGQSYEDVGAMMAFLTRRGLDVNMAATSVARALELMVNPKTVERMEDMGIKVRDANGEFLPMIDIVGQLHDKFGQMTAPERAKAMEALFKGAGNRIQARRFFDTAIPGFQGLLHEIDRMEDRSGAAERAYDTMFEQPISQIELFKNNIQILKDEIGEGFFGSLNKLVQGLIKVVEWFRSLDPEVRNNIVRFLAIAAAIMAVVGPIMMLLGVMGILMGALTGVGIGFASVLAASAGLIIGIIALAIAVMLIIKHWDKIKAFFQNLWARVQEIFDAAITTIKGWLTSLGQWWDGIYAQYIGPFVDAIRNAWDAISSAFQTAWDTITTNTETAWSGLQIIWQGIVDAINWVRDTASTLWQAFQTAWDNIVAGAQWAWNNVLRPIWDAIVAAAQWLGDTFQTIWNGIATAISVIWQNTLGPVFNFIVTAVQIIIDIFRVVGSIASAIFNGIATVVGVFWAIVGGIFSALWQYITHNFIPIMEATGEVVGRIFGYIGDFIAMVWNDYIEPVWTTIVDFLRVYLHVAILGLQIIWDRVWNAIITILSWAWNNIINPIWQAIQWALENVLIPLFNMFMEGVEVVWNTIVDVVRWAWDNVIEPIWLAIQWYIDNILIPTFQQLGEWFQDAWEGIVEVAEWAWNNVLQPTWDAIISFVIDDLWGAIQDFFQRWREGWNDLAANMRNIWNAIKQGAVSGINSVIGAVEGWINRIIDAVNRLFKLLDGLPGVDMSGNYIDHISLQRVSAGVVSGGTRQTMQRFHEGGVVRHDRTALGDNVTATLRAGEGVLNNNAMRLVGPDLLERLNRGQDIFGLKAGSVLETGGLWEDFLNLGKRALEAVYDRMITPLTMGEGFLGDLGIGVGSMLRGIFSKIFDKVQAAPQLSGGIGWRSMWGAVSRVFDWARLHSAFRPGAITATGNRSYHGMGRAIDITPSMTIANWIRQHYMPQTRELIFSPMGARQIHNGSDHYYSGVTRSMHWDHIHWAMANGGIIREPVFGIGRSGATYSFGERGPESVLPFGDGLGIGQNLTGYFAGGIPNIASWTTKFPAKYKGVMDSATAANLDSAGKLVSAVNAMVGHVSAQRTLSAARQTVQELHREVVAINREVLAARIEAKRVTPEEQLGIIASKRAIRDAENNLYRVTSGVVGLEHELAVLQQKAQVDELRKNLEEMKGVFADPDRGLEQYIANVGTAQANLTAAQFEMERIKDVIPLLDNQVDKLLLQYRAESELAGAQQAFANAQQELNDQRGGASVTADELRIAEIELRLAEDKLRQNQQATLHTDELLREAQINLTAARENHKQVIIDSTGPTDRLREAQERQKNVTQELRDAQMQLSEAELATVSATMGMIKAGQDLVDVSPQQYRYFMELARVSGMSTESILALTNAQNALQDTAGIGAIRAIFMAHGVPIGTRNETEAARLARIYYEVSSGQRTLADVEQSVKRIADLTGITRDKGGILPTGTSIVRNTTGSNEFIFNRHQLTGMMRPAVSISEGAVQITFNGWISDDMKEEVRDVIDDAFGELIDELKVH